MKKLALFATAFSLTATLFTSCSKSASSTDDDATAFKIVDGDSIPVSKIVYYDLDKVTAEYKLVEKLSAEAQQSMDKLQSTAQQKDKELQNLAASLRNLESEIQRKMNSNGYLSEASYNADMEKYQKKATELQKKQAEAENLMADYQQQLSQQIAANQAQVLDSINSFLADFNRGIGFDYILIKQPGQYYNPELDITKEIVEGLNARYKE